MAHIWNYVPMILASIPIVLFFVWVTLLLVRAIIRLLKDFRNHGKEKL